MSEFIWKKSSRLGADVPTDSTNAKKVLVIYTGGTIGMKWSKDNGECTMVAASSLPSPCTAQAINLLRTTWRRRYKAIRFCVTQM